MWGDVARHARLNRRLVGSLCRSQRCRVSLYFLFTARC